MKQLGSPPAWPGVVWAGGARVQGHVTSLTRSPRGHRGQGNTQEPEARERLLQTLSRRALRPSRAACRGPWGVQGPLLGFPQAKYQMLKTRETNLPGDPFLLGPRGTPCPAQLWVQPPVLPVRSA